MHYIDELPAARVAYRFSDGIDRCTACCTLRT